MHAGDVAGDLDAADLGEVRRRVVDPVLLAGLRPGELDDVELTFGPPRSWSGSPVDADDVPDVWLTVVARGETFWTTPVRATFERWPAYDVAVVLADQLEDWLPETGFAWGQRRVVDIGPTVPRMAERRPGAPGRAIEVYPDPDSPSLLWDGSRGLDPTELGLSAPLVDALARWRARWQDLANHGAWGPCPRWLAVVGELEPARRDLVAALRRQVPPGDVVLEPIALDAISWQARRRD